MPRLRFAGQITGVEGYVESAAIGLLAGRFAAAERLGAGASRRRRRRPRWARSSRHITGGADAKTFQPMNVNFGLFPPLPDGVVTRANRGERKPLLARRALADLDRLARPRVARRRSKRRRRATRLCVLRQAQDDDHGCVASPRCVDIFQMPFSPGPNPEPVEGRTHGYATRA